MRTQKAVTTLKFTFGLLPIVAGIDKFTNILTDWSGYLAPEVINMLPVSPEAFMIVVGVIEILAGILVLTRWTQIGAAVVSLWLVLISINLTVAGYYDVAARDVALALGAYSLFLLTSHEWNREEENSVESV